MASCMAGIGAVALAGSTETESAVAVLLQADVFPPGTLAADAQLAATVVSGANANGIVASIQFGNTDTNPATNIVSIVTYATAFATALAGDASAPVYFAPTHFLRDLHTNSSPPGGYLFVQAPENNLYEQLMSAETPGLRFVLHTLATSVPAAGERCGFPMDDVAFQAARPPLTSDCSDVSTSVYQLPYSVSMAAAPTVPSSRRWHWRR